jgi:hypothetical protein
MKSQRDCCEKLCWVSSREKAYLGGVYPSNALLCLAARHWIFRQFEGEEVGRMVLMETSLVCNETLAYLALQSGLHKHLIHRDPTLPGRIEMYAWAVNEQDRGLWGTDPPKAIADVVESVLGAVHESGGFESGQRAALHVIEPVARLLLSSGDGQEAVISHPKRSLLEIGGTLVSLVSQDEAGFANEAPDASV